jgi:hypothetical protein
MHLRRVACILLGAWLAGSVVIGWVAASNFAIADRVLASSPAEIQSAMAPLDATRSRMLLRWLVASENADCFLRWELVEFALLPVLAAVLLRDRQTRWLSTVPAALIIFVGFQHFRITPEIIYLGQNMVRGIATARQHEQFASMHKIYGAIEVLKLLLGIVLAVWLVTMKVRRRRNSSADDASNTAFDRRYAT